ncbi:MAG: hypothetical protein AAF826_02610, partial [Pseudomonadota bacterium]
MDRLINIDTSVTPAPAGGLLEIPFTITNNGFGPPDPAPATTLEIVVPATTSFESFSGDVTNCAPLPAAAGTTVTCDVPELAADGGTATLLFGIVSTVSGSVELAATVIGNDDDNSNNSLPDPTNLTFTSGADVELLISGPPAATSGELVDYVFTVSNNGPDPVDDVTLTIPFPSGLDNFTPPAGCTAGATGFECVVPGPIPVNGSVPLTLGAQVTAAGPSTLSVLGSVSEGDPLDPDTSNNSDTLDTSVAEGSDLGVTKSIGPAGVILVGDAATFTIGASFVGNEPTNIVVTDVVPDNYSIQAVNAPAPWNCSVSAQTVTCTHPGGAQAPANGDLGEIEIMTEVVQAGTPINTAVISADGPADPNPDNDSASDAGATLEDPFVDFAGSKSGPNPPLVVVGQDFEFELTTTNEGNADFVGTVSLIDILPADMEIRDYGTSGWVCDTPLPVVGPATVTCSLTYPAASPLQAGETTEPLIITAAMTRDVDLTNGLQVVSNGNFGDGNSSNDAAEFSVSAANEDDSADVSVNKVAARATLPVGEVQTFTIEVVNEGDSVAGDVRVRDLLQDLKNANFGPGEGVVALRYQNISAADANCSLNSVSATVQELACDIDELAIC